MNAKFFHHGMLLEEYLRLNFDSLPAQLQWVIRNNADDADAHISELEREIDGLHETIMSLEAEVEYQQALIEDLKSSIEKYKSALGA